ncbi:MAG: M48 family metallopeptidase [Acholeplasmataceae bacterium]
MKTISKHGRTLSYRVEVKANKHTYLRVKPGYILVTTNARMRIRDIEAIILKRFDTYAARLDELENREKDDRITLWGRTYELILKRGPFAYTIDADLVCATAPTASIAEAKRAIYGEEMRRALPGFERAIERDLRMLQIAILPVRIKYLKSKFGSYHRKHNEITLNSYLAQLDPVYTKYVLYHEYAHTVVFDHSKDFYRVLDRLMPEHRRYQKRLKRIVIHA